MSDPKQILQEVQKVFLARISEKNSWGKNEIVGEWQATLVEVLLKKLEPPAHE